MAFRLFKHEQLTIRNFAVKTYTRFLSQCDISVHRSTQIPPTDRGMTCFIAFDYLQEAAKSLEDCLRELCRDVDLTKHLPHNVLSQPNFHFLDPFEAESLLGVCIYLIKVVIPTFSVSENKIVSSICDVPVFSVTATKLHPVASCLLLFRLSIVSRSPGLLSANCLQRSVQVHRLQSHSP